jgi:hypothetical protein
MPKIRKYAGKTELLERYAAGRSVLHLGAVGETYGDTQWRVDHSGSSVHAKLTAVADRCIGVDVDEPAVTELTERRVFDNLICADVTRLRRADVALDRIDVIVVGDTIEHLSNPGDLLDAMSEFADEGSQVLLTTPNALGLMIFLRHLRGDVVEGFDHVCSFNQFSLANLLARHGWQIDELWTCYQDFAAGRGGLAFRAGRAVFRLQPRLGGTLFAVCSRA